MLKTALKLASAPVAIATVLLVGTEPGRKLTRKAVKETIKSVAALSDVCKQLFEETEETGLCLIEQMKESTAIMVDKVKESTADVIEEAKSELRAREVDDTECGE